MKVIHSQGNDSVAKVYVARLSDGERIEFVESIQPPVPREKKWVLIVSTLRGCPVRCPICDAGNAYMGTLSASEIFAQLDYMIDQRFTDKYIAVEKFKIQFARMGDPAFNPSVLEVLEELPLKYNAPGLMPCISTIAPVKSMKFLDKLTEIKARLYSNGNFQMQFSIHTTCEDSRKKLIPCPTLSFDNMARWGNQFVQEGDRKIALNFAAVKGFPLDPSALERYFSPSKYLIKLTPVNPTSNSNANGLQGLIDPDDIDGANQTKNLFVKEGYDTILSIGDLSENQIGSNCGMYISAK